MSETSFPCQFRAPKREFHANFHLQSSGGLYYLRGKKITKIRCGLRSATNYRPQRNSETLPSGAKIQFTASTSKCIDWKKCIEGANNVGLNDLHLAREYRTGEQEPVAAFYKPCIEQAIGYDRATGYFKSSVLSLASQEICEFALRGGAIRVVCSPDLSTADVEKLISVHDQGRKDYCIEVLTNEIRTLEAETGLSDPLAVFATLLKFGVLEIKIATPAYGKGIYHEKLGVFRDEDRAVSFKGSINETFLGWSEVGNFESIDVYTDWGDSSDQARVKSHQSYFDRLWQNDIKGVIVFDVPQALKNRVFEHALPTIPSLRDLSLFHPKPPNRRTPFEHQSAAIEAWRANGCRGILKHATGSGKTFTAILLIEEMLQAGRPIIVLVPSTLLQKQWRDELKGEFPEAAIQLFGGCGKGKSAARQISLLTRPGRGLGQRIVVAIMATASQPWFREAVRQSDELCVISDETHQLGSRRNSQFFEIEAGARLGLSATPERHGDPVGTRRLFDYFGGIVQPEYNLQEALRDKRLCQYQYFPMVVHLTATEADLWREETKEIQKEYVRSKTGEDGTKIISDRLQMLIINRSRIAKKAHQKIDLAVDIVRENFQTGQQWLVYCEDQFQLAEVLTGLREAGYSPVEYHSAMQGDKEASLKWFKDVGGILVSIKCLDEGVDIPEVSHALILASSQNPRQFIQRRGRVLRSSKDKTMAYIYDAIVTPISLDEEPEQAGLLQAELARAIEFATTAINRNASATLRQIAIDLGVDIEAAQQRGFEEEDENG